MSRYFVWTQPQREQLRGLVASGLSAREIGPTFGLSRKAVIDAVRKHNLGPWIPKQGAPGDGGHIPDDFAVLWQTNSLMALGDHYGRAPATMSLWAKRLGLHRAQGQHLPKPEPVKKPEPKPALRLIKPNAFQTAPVNKFQRDMSAAGQAADFLRKFGPVYRCDVLGRPLSDGFFWRRGNAVMTDDELIERADWLRSKAA